jgi:flagellar biosynthesis/type III secretory pathway M-ring protein FliF/YscJ
MSITAILIIVGIVVVVGIILWLVLRSKFSNRITTKATEDVAISKANDKDRGKVIQVLKKHQENIKKKVDEVDAVVAKYEDDLSKKRKEADERRDRLDAKAKK